MARLKPTLIINQPPYSSFSSPRASAEAWWLIGKHAHRPPPHCRSGGGGRRRDTLLSAAVVRRMPDVKQTHPSICHVLMDSTQWRRWRGGPSEELHFSRALDAIIKYLRNAKQCGAVSFALRCVIDFATSLCGTLSGMMGVLDWSLLDSPANGAAKGPNEIWRDSALGAKWVVIWNIDFHLRCETFEWMYYNMFGISTHAVTQRFV